MPQPARTAVWRWLILALGILVSTSTTAQDLVGVPAEHLSVDSDTLADIAVAHDLGYDEVVAANPGVDPWLPGAGIRLTLPSAHLLPDAPRQGVVINLAEMRLYHFRPGHPPESYPIGIGTDGVEIPIGRSSVRRKRPNPVWVPPPSVLAEDPELPPAVPPGPDNPLGHFALDLAWPRVVIHGTNRPYGVGRRVSHGCFRLYPADIERLYAGVVVGTPVAVVVQPIKVGWHQGELWLQVHPTLNEISDLDIVGHIRTWEELDPQALLLARAGDQAPRIDWTVVHATALARLGVPVRVTGSAN
jgi:L,D-transpeptidase ErfK/SrfK